MSPYTFPTPRFFGAGKRPDPQHNGYTESYCALRMPWRRRMYTINNDSQGMHRPMFIACWSRRFGGFRFRCGWVPT